MKAIILAAGIGNRLESASHNRPKCLLELGGKTLLERHIENLTALDITEINIVTGFESRLIEDYLQTLKTGLIKTIFNPDYTQGSVISFYSGKELSHQDEDIILMDADVLYSRKILERLINSKLNNVFLLDRNFESGEEPVKLCVKDQQLIEFRKQIDKNLDFDYQGESVGFFKFTAEVFRQLLSIAEKYINNGQTEQPYEEVIRDLLLDKPALFHFEDITGLPWIEIDFPEDIQRATNDILPEI